MVGSGFANIVSVGYAVPETHFSQEEVAAILGVHTEKGKRFFAHPHISKRHLHLPSHVTSNQKSSETTEELLKRFKKNSVALSAEAIKNCLESSSLKVDQIDMICCVTSTGFIVPALSSILSNQLGLKNSVQRLDIVGMGCNAGLNGLNAVSTWAQTHPGKFALLICCEISSAIYSADGSEESALVNSLFGDGAVACIVSNGTVEFKERARILDFETHLIPNSSELLRFDWDANAHRFKFIVDRKTPEFMASQVSKPLERILSRNKIHKKEISHWIVHSGGEAILAGIEKTLSLKPSDLRHTRSVLKEFGNISSGSFLVSYIRLLNEGIIQPGDKAMMITMGPGLTIEAALLSWGK